MNLAFIRPLCTLVILFKFVKDENTKLSPCDEMYTFKLNLLLQALNSREGLAELLVPQTIVSGKPRAVGSAAPKPAPAPIFPHARPSASARPSAPSDPPSPLPIHKVSLPSPRRSVPGVLDPPSVQHGPTRAHTSPRASTQHCGPPGVADPRRSSENQFYRFVAGGVCASMLCRFEQ